MGLTEKLVFGGILTSSLILTLGCRTSDKEWSRYLEDQVPCEFTVKKGDSYWKMAERLKKGSQFDNYYTGWLGQKLENYDKDNPLNKDLKPGMEIKVPCGLTYQ